MGATCPTCGQPVAPLADPDKSQLGPFQAHSDTSRLAALRAYPRQGSQRWQIIQALAHKAMTRDELVSWLRLRGNAIRPRIVELREGGWVQPLTTPTGAVVTRPTATGCEAEVLTLTLRGRAALATREAA